LEKKFKIAAFGEVLWDLLPDASVLGGAPFNFTYRINSIGNEGLMISAVGNDDLGKLALKTISDLQISGQYIQIDPKHPTGTVNVYFDEFKNPDYEIIKRVAYDFVTYNDELETLIKKVDCICYGTLAQRNPVSQQTLQKLLQQFNGRFRFYDLNLRKECFTTENIISSLKNANVLKLNEKEAIEISSLLQLNQNGLTDICKKLIEMNQLKYCVVTLEERGSLAVSEQNEIVYTPGFKIELNDPLGSGDAFSAGFVDALLKGKSLQEAGESGNQLGALVATKKGATEKITEEEKSDLIRKNKRITDKTFGKLVSA
jgi:fructokinase